MGPSRKRTMPPAPDWLKNRERELSQDTALYRVLGDSVNQMGFWRDFQRVITAKRLNPRARFLRLYRIKHRRSVCDGRKGIRDGRGGPRREPEESGVEMAARGGALAGNFPLHHRVSLPAGEGGGHQHDAGTGRPGAYLHQQIRLPSGEHRARRRGGVPLSGRPQQELHQADCGRAGRPDRDFSGGSDGERQSPGGALRACGSSGTSAR